MLNINVIFHSVSGHTFKLADALRDGVAEVSGCGARLLRIPEPAGDAPITMPGLEKRHHEFSDVPEASIEDFANCDGLAIGTAVYWGNMSYATKHYLDSTAKLWGLGSPNTPVRTAPKLAGKPATVFTGGGTGLGNDTAIVGVWCALATFGMTIVTLGIAVPEVSEPTRVDGGSPFGAGTFSRRPGPHPTAIELAIARKQGRALAETTRAWVNRPTM